MLDLGLFTAAEHHRRELLEEAKRDRLADQAREYALRNTRRSRSSGSIPHRLGQGLVAVFRRQLAANQA
jgi:hypothetical protein